MKWRQTPRAATCRDDEPRASASCRRTKRAARRAPTTARAPSGPGPRLPKGERNAQGHHHGSRRTRLPQLQRRLPRRPGHRGRRVHGDADPRHRRPHLPGVARRAALPGRHPDPARRTSSRSSSATSGVDEVVLAYSDLKHETRDAQGVDRCSPPAPTSRLLGPRSDDARSRRSRSSRCAPSRTGCGKSQTSRKVGQTLLDAGLKVALVRHPMPYGDLEAMRVQRFATLEDIDASHPTVEEREEYEEPGADWAWSCTPASTTRRSCGRPRRRPTSSSGTAATTTSRSTPRTCSSSSPTRCGPGTSCATTRARRTSGWPTSSSSTRSTRPRRTTSSRCSRTSQSVNPMATVDLRRVAAVTLDDGPDLLGQARARRRGRPDAHARRDAVRRRHRRRPRGRRAEDRRPAAVRGRLDRGDLRRSGRSIGERPAGDGLRRRAARTSSRQTINAADCDVVVTGTPIDLGRLIDSKHPIRHVRVRARRGRRADARGGSRALHLGAHEASDADGLSRLRRRPRQQ